MMAEHEHEIDESNIKLPDIETLNSASELLRSLSAPVRIAIILLLESPKCVHEIVNSLKITQPLVSQHLRILRNAGVVKTKREGKEIFYSLKDNHLAQIIKAAVEHVEE